MTMDSWVALATIAGFGLTILTVMHQSLRGLESRLGARIDTVETTLSNRIDRFECQVDQRFESVETALGARIDRLDLRCDRFDDRFDSLSAQVYELNTRVTAAIGLPRTAEG